MDKIKILYALESAGGGTLKHVVYLATGLDKSKFDITVVLPDKNYEADTLIAVALLRQCGIHIDIIRIVKRFSPVRDSYALLKLCSYLKNRQFDIVHAHSSKAGVLFRLATLWVKVPVVIYTPHCFHFMAHSGIRKCFYVRIERMLAKITDCIAISGTEEMAINKERIKPLREISIIDNAIDPDEYKRTDAKMIRKLCNIPEHHKIVVGVGRLVKQKNWEAFLNTAALVLKYKNAVTFIIAGDGSHYRHLSTMIDKLGISDNIRLCGYLYDVSQVYSGADIFVSTSSWEGLPYTYLEALHFNLPMLISSTEGMEYFFKHVNAIPIPLNDCNYLCEKMLDLLSNPVEIKNENPLFPFTIDRFIKQHKELYLQLLAK
jgi:glycosyltransferase involved in cell wall biosynthesis